jgi:hypothetical protein
MAEEKMYTIHNMCRAQSSRAQRAVAVTQHRAALWVDGQKVLPKRPLKISVEDFNKLESEILKKLREGRLAFTTPEQYYVDSRSDGRIYVKRPGHQIVEEKVISSDYWRLLFEKPTAPAGELPVPLKDWVGPGPTDDAPLGTDQEVPFGEAAVDQFRAGPEGPAGMTGPDCGEQSLGPQGLPGVVPITDEVSPVVDSVTVEVRPEESAPTTASEEVTSELPDPNTVLTLDTPTSTPVEDLKTKSKKRRR